MFFFDSTKKIFFNGSQLSNEVKYILDWYEIDINTHVEEENDEQVSKTSVSILREPQL